MSRVVVVKLSGYRLAEAPSAETYKTLLSIGLLQLSGESEVTDALRKYLPSGPIGIKTNCLARKLNSTPVALADAATQLLVDAGFAENDVVVWERTNRELSGAGFTLNASHIGRRCLGTDTNDVGYSREFFSFGEVNSLVTSILVDMVAYNINLPILKDHSVAGMSGGMKNMYGAINNPNKYHADNCDPFCAHVFNLRPIKDKTRLTVIDAMKVQYHGGPGYISDYMAPYGGLILAADPVAADAVGLRILEQLRQMNGQLSLEKAGRPVRYLQTAEKIGLGTADLNRIDLQVVEVDNRGRQKRGELF